MIQKQVNYLYMYISALPFIVNLIIKKEPISKKEMGSFFIKTKARINKVGS